MSFDELIIFGVMLLVIFGSWIGNLIKEAQQKQAEKERQTRRQSSSNLDEAVARRRERLRELAKQRQQQQADYEQRYGELETTQGESTGYSRYGQLEQTTQQQGYERYDDANAEALEQYSRYRQPTESQPGQPSGYERYTQAKRTGGDQARTDYSRYRQPQERAPGKVRDQLETQTIRRSRDTPAQTQRQAQSQQPTRQPSPPQAQPGGTNARQASTDAPSHEEVAGPMEREARMRQQGGPAITAAVEGPHGQPTAAAARIRRQLTSGSVKQLFIIKELFDKPIAMRDQLGIDNW